MCMPHYFELCTYNVCNFANLQKMCACGFSFICVVVTHIIQLRYENSI